MRWQGRRRSSNVQDRRGLGGRGVALGGGGIVGLIFVVLFVVMGGDPRVLLQSGAGPGGSGSSGPAGPAPGITAQSDEAAQFIAVVLADTEDVWNALFQRQLGQEYAEPQLVLFSGQVDSACGFASAAVGPFYCPPDRQVYIDLTFFRQLQEQLGAPGDFAQAYVVAHEVGHHVQNQLGYTQRLHAQRGRISEVEYNRLSVRLELHADFLAGVWAHHAQRTKNILEPGDLEEALRAAGAVGDDTLQRRQQGHVVPDSFTHGTSEQRIRWFRRGFETGDLRAGEALWEEGSEL